MTRTKPKPGRFAQLLIEELRFLKAALVAYPDEELDRWTDPKSGNTIGGTYQQGLIAGIDLELLQRSIKRKKGK